MDCDKMDRLSIFMCEDGISFKPKNTFLKLDSQRPMTYIIYHIYQIDGNFMTIPMDFLNFPIQKKKLNLNSRNHFEYYLYICSKILVPF